MFGSNGRTVFQGNLIIFKVYAGAEGVKVIGCESKRGQIERRFFCKAAVDCLLFDFGLHLGGIHTFKQFCGRHFFLGINVHTGFNIIPSYHDVGNGSGIIAVCLYLGNLTVAGKFCRIVATFYTKITPIEGKEVTHVNGGLAIEVHIGINICGIIEVFIFNRNGISIVIGISRFGHRKNIGSKENFLRFCAFIGICIAAYCGNFEICHISEFGFRGIFISVCGDFSFIYTNDVANLNGSVARVLKGAFGEFGNSYVLTVGLIQRNIQGGNALSVIDDVAYLI